ncbi:Ribonuclease D [compost metagenome]
MAEPPSPPPDEATLALADLLQAVTHTVAAESGIAASLLATNGDLQRLAEAYRRGDSLSLSFLEGWRGALLGERLRAILEGRSALGWDPKNHALRLLTV